MAESVTLYHPGFILGVPGEQSPGVYEVEGSEIVSFAPLPASGGDDNPVETLGSPTDSASGEQANQSADTQQGASVGNTSG